jgi:hypothetical protein
MKKKLNSSTVLSELAEESVFFKKLSLVEKPSENNSETERTENRSEIRTEERAEFRSYNLPFKRNTKRYSFEFYDDQVIRIKKIKLNTEMAGERISMSEIVRQALDEYFDKRSPEPFGNSFVRNNERTKTRTEKD